MDKNDKAIAALIEKALSPYLFAIRDQTEASNEILSRIEHSQKELPQTFKDTLFGKGDKGEKGDAGVTPVLSIDYFTRADKAAMIKAATPVKGVHYNDGARGADGKNGKTPKVGVDFFTKEEIDSFLFKATPRKGVHYFTGAEVTQFKKDIIASLDLKQEAQYDPTRIVNALESIKDKKSKLSMDAIAGLKDALLAAASSGPVSGGTGAGNSGGTGTSPLTTKGDLFTFSTVAARLGVGADGTVLTADSTQTTGLRWEAVGGTGTVTSVTSADANATVANTTTTPVITIVSAPKWATARNLAGNSVDGSANVAFANKFIVQGTSDTGLSAAQFLGALTTGIVKNTTTTGVLSIAVAADFPTLNQSTTGNAATVTTNANLTGMVTSIGNATSLGSFTSANLAAALTDETGSGAAVFATSPTITGASLGSTSTAVTQSPSDNSTKLATTAYVDNAVLGQDFKQAVSVATTSVLASYVYNNGTSGVGATITLVATGVVSFDGTALTAGMRVLVKNETSTNTPNNGIYTVTVAGAVGTALVLTRATDFDQPTDVNAGDSVFVTSGTTQGTTTWAYNSTSAPTFGTTNITFAQTAGQGSFTAGNGIAITGLSIAIDTSVTVDKSTAQTLTGIKTFSPTARTSGVASYFTVNAPADTGQTASTESKGVNIVGATRTWADGTVTTQREYFFGAPTYNKTTTAATFMNAGTVVIGGAPAGGTGVTITHPWALWVQGGNSHFGSQIGYTQAATGGTGIEVNDSNNNTGGHVVTVQNTNSGTSAYSGLNIGNDQSVDGAATSHYFGIFFNSSTYSDTSFGTAVAIPSLGALQNTDGPISLQTYVIGSPAYINFVIGGAATTNEIARLNTSGLTIGLAGTLTGKIAFAGATSGAIALQGQAVGGSNTLTLPAATDTLVGKATTDTLTNKRVQPRTSSAASTSTLTPDLSSANVYYLTAQAATLTIAAPIGTPVIGETIVIYVLDNATPQTLTINSTFKAFGVAFPATTTASKTFMLSAQFNGTDWKALWANAI